MQREDFFGLKYSLFLPLFGGSTVVQFDNNTVSKVFSVVKLC